MAMHVEAMVAFQDAGCRGRSDYGNSIRDEARQGGFSRAFEIEVSAPLHPAPLLEGKVPFRLGGALWDPKNIGGHRQGVLELFPTTTTLHRWIRRRQEMAFQGLGRSAICWPSATASATRRWLRFNELVASASERTDRDRTRHLDFFAADLASPYRETEAMADGSDAIADWPLLNSPQ